MSLQYTSKIGIASSDMADYISGTNAINGVGIVWRKAQLMNHNCPLSSNLGCDRWPIDIPCGHHMYNIFLIKKTIKSKMIG